MGLWAVVAKDFAAKRSHFMQMRRIAPIAVTVLALATAALLSAPAAPAHTVLAHPAPAHTPFDGKWSVLIVTDAGTCDRAYRYALNINKGRVSYDDPSFSVSGHVDRRGNVSVSVSAGDDRASGTGQLSGDYGSGDWTGRSAVSACSGHWQAERRG
jgi:hypothetical protein